MARKNRYTTDQVKQALIDANGLVYIAAESLGCRSAAVYSYIKRYKEIEEVLNEQREVIIDKAESKLFEQIEKGEQWAIQFALKTIGKHRGYTEKTETENKSDINVNMNVMLPSKAPTSEEWLKENAHLAPALIAETNGKHSTDESG